MHTPGFIDNLLNSTLTLAIIEIRAQFSSINKRVDMVDRLRHRSHRQAAKDEQRTNHAPLHFTERMRGGIQ